MEASLTITMDSAGRVVIPVAIRRELALAGGAELEATVEGGSLHLRPVGTVAIASRGRRLVISTPPLWVRCRIIGMDERNGRSGFLTGEDRVRHVGPGCGCDQLAS